MYPPTDPVSVTGYIIQVSWQRPSGNTGLLTHYILTAYDQDRQGEMVQERFEDTSPGEYRGNDWGDLNQYNVCDIQVIEAVCFVKQRQQLKLLTVIMQKFETERGVFGFESCIQTLLLSSYA